MPIWLHNPRVLALGKWLHYRGYLGHEYLFCIVLVYSCHLFLISSASVKSIPFLSFIKLIFAWNVPLVSLNFPEEISSLSHSVVFLYFFALITGEGFLISSCYSLELCIQMLISFFSPLLFISLLFTVICKASSDNYFAFCISFLWSTGEGNGKPLQYSCLEKPMNSMKRQNDRILKEELPMSVGAQYATGGQWRNNSRKNEGMEPKQKQYPVVDVTGDRSKVQCCK